MKRFPFYALVGFFVLLYTHGLWARFGISKMVLEGSLLALPLGILLGQRGILRQPPPGFLFLWFYLGWSLAACIYNDEGVLRGLLYSRYLIVSYFVFWAVWSSRFTSRQLCWIHGVIFTMFFVQVAAASFYWLVLDQRFEYVVGTMGYGSGGIATIFPMFAFSCLLAFFLHYNRSIFLIAGFSFFVVGYASGKLGIYILIPPMLVLGVVLYAIREGVPSALQRSGVIVLIAACMLPFLVFLLSRTSRVETESLQNETGLYHKIVAFSRHNYAGQTTSESGWYTTTRVGTSRRVLAETLHGSPLVFLFGRGPRVCLMDSNEAVSRYGILYGLVGWSADAMAVGWPAVFAHVGFYTYLFYLLLKSRGGRDPYWKAIRLIAQLGFFVFLFSYFLYSTNFTTGGWLSSVYLCFLAVLLAPQYREVLDVLPAACPPSAARATRRVAWRESLGASLRPESTLF